jgi:hypothetical protein
MKIEKTKCAECQIEFLIEEEEMEDENFCQECSDKIYAQFDSIMDEAFLEFVNHLESTESNQL